MAGGGGGRSAASTSGKRGKFLSPVPMKKARIEIVPLIDVMFFLLAAFMMVSLCLACLE
jgi:biopolymer transport protein ExbD